MNKIALTTRVVSDLDTLPVGETANFIGEAGAEKYPRRLRAIMVRPTANFVQEHIVGFGFAAVAPLEIFRKISQNFSPAGVTSPLVARAIPMASCVVIGEQAAAFIQSQNKGLDRRRLRLTSDMNLPVAGVEQSKELLNIAAGQKGH